MDTLIIAKKIDRNLPKNVQLKSLKVNHDLSEETFNFSATLYVGGKRLAKVTNHGQGGPDNFEWAFEGADKIAHEIGSEYCTEFESPYDLEVLIGEMINYENLKKEAKRSSKGKFAYVVYARDVKGSSLIRLHSLDKLADWLADCDAIEYEVFEFEVK